jgi:Resolvase, N terminal domain
MNLADNPIGDGNKQAPAVLFLSIASPRGASGGLEAIAMQRERGQEKAAVLNARVAHEFVEIGVAARGYRERPLMLELLHYLDENPDIRYAIFPTTGRVARRLEDFQELMSEFDNRGVVVTFPYGDPLVPPAAREALWLTTEWVRERSLAARAQRRRRASAS